MNKILSIFVFLIIPSYFCIAQKGYTSPADRMQIAKMSFMSRQLNLSSLEAERFFPVYNEYVAELRGVKATYTNDEILSNEKVVEIKKKYKIIFTNILGSEQRANRVFIAEREFRDMVFKERQERSGRRSRFLFRLR
ncbi:MAG: hypothetical protein LBE82_09165 [Chitinophagaceae bacterium]|jgi:hypothetical protein|nr:hypothetical protein [Chitinophagaceae bacterium]